MRSWRLAPLFRSSLATSTKPSRAAMWSGVHPAEPKGNWAEEYRQQGLEKPRPYTTQLMADHTFLVSRGRVRPPREEYVNYISCSDERRPDKGRVSCERTIKRIIHSSPIRSGGNR